jgi:hypothetical protein
MNNMNNPYEQYKHVLVKSEEELLTAMKTNNIIKLESLLHDDLLFILPTGQSITKKMDLEEYQLGNMDISEITLKAQEINIIEDSAVIVATIEMKGSYLAHSLDGNYRFIRVWKLIEGNWKVIAGSSTLLP